MFKSKENDCLAKVMKEIADLECHRDTIRANIESLRVINGNMEVEHKKKKLDLEIQAAKDQGDFEHAFHYGKEKRNAELALLDAKIEERKRYLNMQDEFVKAMKDIVLLLSGHARKD